MFSGTGEPLEAGVEVAQVLLDLLRRVAVRIDADEYHLQVVAHLLRQLALQFAELGEGGRADIGAEGVAEEQQVPATLETGGADRLAVLVGELQRRHLARLRQDHDAGVEQHGGIGLALGGEHLVHGEAEDQGDQGDEDEDGLVDSSHGWARL